jgi:hypothetical protein
MGPFQSAIPELILGKAGHRIGVSAVFFIESEIHRSSIQSHVLHHAPTAVP